VQGRSFHDGGGIVLSDWPGGSISVVCLRSRLLLHAGGCCTLSELILAVVMSSREKLCLSLSLSLSQCGTLGELLVLCLLIGLNAEVQDFLEIPCIFLL
jgi:hypothetical protein